MQTQAQKNRAAVEKIREISPELADYITDMMQQHGDTIGFSMARDRIERARAISKEQA